MVLSVSVDLTAAGIAYEWHQKVSALLCWLISLSITSSRLTRVVCSVYLLHHYVYLPVLVVCQCYKLLEKTVPVKGDVCFDSWV